MSRRRRRRGQRASARRPGRRTNSPLTEQEERFLHDVIARARLLGRPIQPAAKEAWRTQYGSELTRGTFVFHCYSPKREARRRATLDELARDPTLIASVSPVFAVRQLTRAARQALRSRIWNVKAVNTTAPDGTRRQRVYEFRRVDIQGLVAVIEEMRRWFVLLFSRCPHCGKARVDVDGPRGREQHDGIA